MSAPPGRTTPAVGGERSLPMPDPIARDYIVLCLRIDQHVPGFVDAYFGPADLKAKVELEPVRSATRLRDDVLALRERVAAAEVDDSARRRWLAAQLTAIEAQVRALAGDPLPYADHVAACFDARMARRPDSAYAAAAANLADLVPGEGPLAARLAAWDARFVIPPARLSGVIDRLVAVARERAAADFGLRVGLVTDQPWSGYNWYDGGLQSRVDLNTDLPIQVKRLLDTLCHETYPGHHLEHAWKEADLVATRGRVEASVLTINTPECFISEGLAELGRRFASPPEAEPDLLVDLYALAGLPLADDPAAARDAAERTVAMAGARATLEAAAADAALLRHAEGRTHDEVLAYLRDVGLMSPERAAKLLEFIEHPLWRTYVFVYSAGEELLSRWLEAVAPVERATRFGRLLHEQLTPGAIAGELAARTSPA